MTADCENSQTILAVHCGALGDVILFGHLLGRLGGRVTLLTGGEKGRLLVEAKVVGRAIDFDSLPMQEIFCDTPLEQCHLPALLGEHERLVSCFAAGDRRAELRLAGACGASSAAFLPIRPEEEFGGHLLELWCDLLGVTCDPSAVRAWAIPPAWRTAASDALGELDLERGRRYVTIHPGSGGTKKCWPLERFIDLARKLDVHRRMGEGPQPLFVLGPAELDRWGEQQCQAIADQFATLQSPPLTTLAGVLAQSAGYFGNDSGVSHLSAAVGTPTLTLFAASSPAHFAPLGPHATVISAPAMEQIRVEQVLEHLKHE